MMRTGSRPVLHARRVMTMHGRTCRQVLVTITSKPLCGEPPRGSCTCIDSCSSEHMRRLPGRPSVSCSRVVAQATRDFAGSAASSAGRASGHVMYLAPAVPATSTCLEHMNGQQVALPHATLAVTAASARALSPMQGPHVPASSMHDQCSETEAAIEQVQAATSHRATPARAFQTWQGPARASQLLDDSD